MNREEFMKSLNAEFDKLELDCEDLKVKNFSLSVNIQCEGKHLSLPRKNIDVGFYFDPYLGNRIRRAPGPYDARNYDDDGDGD